MAKSPLGLAIRERMDRWEDQYPNEFLIQRVIRELEQLLDAHEGGGEAAPGATAPVPHPDEQWRCRQCGIVIGKGQLKPYGGWDSTTKDYRGDMVQCPRCRTMQPLDVVAS
jgi:hypothetical protein